MNLLLLRVGVGLLVFIGRSWYDSVKSRNEVLLLSQNWSRFVTVWSGNGFVTV